MSGKLRKKGDGFRGFIIFFKSVLSWALKAALTLPAKSLLINTHACPVLSWFLSLSIHICVKTHIHTNSWNTQYFLSPYIWMFLYLSTQMFLVAAVHEHMYSTYMSIYTQSNATALHSRASYPGLRDDLDDFKPPFLSSGPYTVQKRILFLPVLVPHDLTKLVAVQWCSLVTAEPWSIPAVPQRPQSQNTRLQIKLSLCQSSRMG